MTSIAVEYRQSYFREPTRRSFVDKAHNDLSAAVPKFCLTLEKDRRTPDGRVRTSQDFLAGFFPHDDRVCSDRILKYLPPEVRGPIIAAWGIRGTKAALRDSDEKLQSVLHDALIAGDVDDAAFEEGLSAETLVQWAPLATGGPSGAGPSSPSTRSTRR